jgi:hypothetical protein
MNLKIKKLKKSRKKIAKEAMRYKQMAERYRAELKEIKRMVRWDE